MQFPNLYFISVLSAFQVVLLGTLMVGGLREVLVFFDEENLPTLLQHKTEDSHTTRSKLPASRESQPFSLRCLGTSGLDIIGMLRS